MDIKRYQILIVFVEVLLLEGVSVHGDAEGGTNEAHLVVGLQELAGVTGVETPEAVDMVDVESGLGGFVAPGLLLEVAGYGGTHFT